MTAVLSVQAALGLVFDGRYRDFPFAPLTGAAIPLLVLGRWRRRSNVPAAEKAMAVTLAVSAVYIVGNESVANWQALWFCGRLCSRWLLLWCRRGTRQAEDQQRGGQAGKIGIMQDQAERGGGERDQYQRDRWPDQIEQGHSERNPAEHRVVVQPDGEPERGAQPGSRGRLGRPARPAHIRSRDSADKAPRRARAGQRAAANWSGGRWAGRAGIAWLAALCRAAFYRDNHWPFGTVAGAPARRGSRLTIRDAAAPGGIGAFPKACSRIPPFPLRRTRI